MAEYDLDGCNPILSIRVGSTTMRYVSAAEKKPLMSGSLDPPLCVTSVARAARMHGFLIEAGHFGVSLLCRRQQRLSAHFAGQSDVT